MELSDDLMTAGDLTIAQRLRVEAAGGTSYFSGADHALEISDGNVEISSSTVILRPQADLMMMAILPWRMIWKSAATSRSAAMYRSRVSYLRMNYTEIMGALTAAGDLDVRGPDLDGLGQTLIF